MLEIALVAVAGDSAEALRHPETLHPPYLCARQLEGSWGQGCARLRI